MLELYGSACEHAILVALPNSTTQAPENVLPERATEERVALVANERAGTIAWSYSGGYLQYTSF